MDEMAIIDATKLRYIDNRLSRVAMLRREKFLRITYVELDRPLAGGIRPVSTVLFHTGTAPGEEVRTLLRLLERLGLAGDPGALPGAAAAVPGAGGVLVLGVPDPAPSRTGRDAVAGDRSPGRRSRRPLLLPEYHLVHRRLQDPLRVAPRPLSQLTRRRARRSGALTGRSARSFRRTGRGRCLKRRWLTGVP